jgi:hypothetical protein
MKGWMKNTLRVSAFLAGLAVLLALASALVIPKDNTEEAGQRDVAANAVFAEPDHTIDVLIVGDSESYSSFVPLRMYERRGFTSYVCGTSGQKLTVTMQFLEEVFRKQSPKIVILETDCLYHYFSLTDLVFLRLNQLLPVFEYHDRWKNLHLSDLDLTVNHTHFDNTKGYWFSTEMKGTEAEGYMETVKDSPDVTGRNKRYVGQIRDYCESRGAQLILVSVPSTVNWNQERHDQITRLSEELGLEYVDLNTAEGIEIDWAHDTYDMGDHLNYFGASKVSDYTADYLSEKGILIDRRTDEEYQAWDEALEAFNQRVSEEQ